jgi:hypothetical protein
MKKRRSFLLVFSVMLFCAPAIQAATFSFNLDVIFSGETNLSGQAPWLTATFTDQGQDPVFPFNVVQLDLKTPGLSTAEFVANWYFNLDPLANIPTLYYSDKTSPSGLTPLPVAINSYLPDSLTAGSAFDFFFAFPTDNSELFSGGRTISYLIEGSGISASLFNALNQTGSYFTAAEVRRTGAPSFTYIAATTTPPSTQPVPEPGTLLLSGIGLTGLAFFWRRKKFLN